MALSSLQGLRPIHHFGVYGVCVREDGKLLTIRKEHGLYKGLLDLPGGQPDGDETPHETLARLVAKETGGVLEEAEAFQEYEFVVKETPEGTPVHYHHTALVAHVKIRDVNLEQVVWCDMGRNQAEVSELVKRAAVAAVA